MRQPKRFIVDATDESPDGDFIYYSEFEELQTKYNFMVSSAKKNAKERDVLIEALKEIGRTKYGLELHDYDNLEYVADYWAKKALAYEQIARNALKQIEETKDEND